MSPHLPSRTRTAECLSDLRLDQLRVGELAPPREAEARLHLDTCERCRERLRGLAADEAELHLPPLDLTGKHASEAPTPIDRSRRRTWHAAIATVAAAAAIIAIVVWPEGDLPVDPLPTTTNPPDVDGGDEDGAIPATQAKGDGPKMSVYVSRGGAVVEANSLQSLLPGDVLGFSYSSKRPRYLALIGRDGAGVVSTYYPDGDHAHRVDPGDDVSVGDGFELDDTLGEEVVFGIFCDREVPVSLLRAAVSDARDEPEPPEDCDLVTLRMTKRAGQ